MGSERKRVSKTVAEFITTAEKPPVVIVLGPTASGKTALAISLAKEFGGEVISADSRQVYRGVDVSSVKVSKEEMDEVPHHLLDIREPNETLTVQEWKQMAEEKIAEIGKRGKLPIVCGGTMLYLAALTKNYDFGERKPNAEMQARLSKMSTAELAKKLRQLDAKEAEKINPQNRRHLLRSVEIAMSGGKKKELDSPFAFLKIGIMWEREELYERINKRAEVQFKSGLIEETKKLKEKYGLGLPALSSFGYEDVDAAIRGKISWEAAAKLNQQRSRNYARRQMTWWKREEDIVWFAGKKL